jgi:signal transduction histidine kinase/CheY-like chemotaxis protein
MRTNKVSWSDELYRILGLDPRTTAATFEGFIAAICPEDRATVQALAARAAAGDVAERADYRVCRPDGTIREILGLAQIFRDDHGAPHRMVGVALDVTEERRAGQVQKMDALGRLAGGVAHDFNNLLTVILLNLEGVLENGAAPDPRLVQARAAGLRAAALTRQLLAFSRALPSKPTALDLNLVLAEALQMIERLIGETVLVRFEPSPQPARVVADENQIAQILLNLVVNARDAMPQGGELCISLVAVDRPHGDPALETQRFIRMSVRDTGTGMDDTTRSRLFEPFFTTKDPGSGTGFGLATVFGIVSRSGGFIEVDTAPGRGSAFHLYLPRTESVESAGVPTTRASSRGADATLLLVEDDAAVRGAVSEVLRGAGYRVIAAARPSEAIEVWQRDHATIAMLVSDVVMPEMSGHELLARLQRDRPKLRAVLMTGYDPDVARTPGVTCLSKPFAPEDLLAAIDTARG